MKLFDVEHRVGVIRSTKFVGQLTQTNWIQTNHMQRKHIIYQIRLFIWGE